MKFVTAAAQIAAVSSLPQGTHDSICGTPQLEEGHRMEEGQSRQLGVLLHAEMVVSTALVQWNESHLFASFAWRTPVLVGGEV